jgi:hypothetical protein
LYSDLFVVANSFVADAAVFAIVVTVTVAAEVVVFEAVEVVNLEAFEIAVGAFAG